MARAGRLFALRVRGHAKVREIADLSSALASRCLRCTGRQLGARVPVSVYRRMKQAAGVPPGTLIPGIQAAGGERGRLCLTQRRRCSATNRALSLSPSLVDGSHEGD